MDYIRRIKNPISGSLLLQTTYAYGGRNFVITNTPLLGCVPAARNLTENGTCSPILNQAAQGLSSGFETLILGLQRQLPNATFVLFDAYNATSAAIAYPSAFGEMLFKAQDDLPSVCPNILPYVRIYTFLRLSVHFFCRLCVIEG